MKPSGCFFYFVLWLCVLFFYESWGGEYVASADCKSKGKASYYSNKFKGRRTSSGQKYHPDSLTCAHHKLPFGTMLEVTNLTNGKTVRVKVNDRLGRKSKRIVDLSMAAARELEMIHQGVIPAKITCVENL
jgi:rare lipoprotein A